MPVAQSALYQVQNKRNKAMPTQNDIEGPDLYLTGIRHEYRRAGRACTGVPGAGPPSTNSNPNHSDSGPTPVFQEELTLNKNCSLCYMYTLQKAP